MHVQAQCLGRRKRMKFQNQKRTAENYSMNFDCTICGRQYRYQESLYVHIKTDHGGFDIDFNAESANIDAVDRNIIERAIENVVSNGLTDDKSPNTSQTGGDNDLSIRICKTEKNQEYEVEGDVENLAHDSTDIDGEKILADVELENVKTEVVQ